LHPLVSNDSGDERLAPHHSPRHSANNSADDDHEFEDEFDDEFEKESEEECEEECEEKFQVEPMMDKDEERGEESEDECERNDDETTEARAEIELDVKSISVPDSQLFDTSIDRQGVLDDIEKLFPQLALSNPKMASFVQELDAYIDSQKTTSPSSRCATQTPPHALYLARMWTNGGIARTALLYMSPFR
jgi:hypothetical protein